MLDCNAEAVTMQAMTYIADISCLSILEAGGQSYSISRSLLRAGQEVLSSLSLAGL